MSAGSKRVSAFSSLRASIEPAVQEEEQDAPATMPSIYIDSNPRITVIQKNYQRPLKRNIGKFSPASSRHSAAANDTSVKSPYHALVPTELLYSDSLRYNKHINAFRKR